MAARDELADAVREVETEVADERRADERREVELRARRRVGLRRRRDAAARRAADLGKRERDSYRSDLRELRCSPKVRAALAKLDPFASLAPFRLPDGRAIVAFTDPGKADRYRVVGGSGNGGLVDGRRLQPLAILSAAHAVRSRFRGETIVAVDPTPADLAKLVARRGARGVEPG